MQLEDKRRRRDIFVDCVVRDSKLRQEWHRWEMCRSYGACGFLFGRFYKYAAPAALGKKLDATMANKPPPPRAVLVLMGFNMIQLKDIFQYLKIGAS